MPNKKIKILIAEDEMAIARALKLKLDHEGFDTSVVFDGREAIKSLEREQFDLLLLDLMMPEVDGFAVLNRLKTKGIKIPVMVVSSLSQIEDVTKAKEMGATDFFIKSTTPLATIVEKIKKFFPEKS